MTILEILLPAFVASLILTGIHAYLGVHVVERGVIFVDLSLAQIAALGTTVAYLAGYDLHETGAYLFSLGFTFLGAAIFAVTRVHRKTGIPQEAIIGIVYVVSAAVAVLLVFCFLIVPSVAAMFFAERLGPRLAIGWTMGTLVSAAGVSFSFLLDLPTGATIVATFGLSLLVLAGYRRAFHRTANDARGESIARAAF